jgi:hypothetical protein
LNTFNSTVQLLQKNRIGEIFHKVQTNRKRSELEPTKGRLCSFDGSKESFLMEMADFIKTTARLKEIMPTSENGARQSSVAGLAFDRSLAGGAQKVFSAFSALQAFHL